MSDAEEFPTIDLDLPLQPQLRAAEAEAEALGAIGLFDQQSRVLAMVDEYFRRSWIDPIDEILRRTNAAMAGLEPAAFRMGQLGWTIPMFGPIPLVRYIVEKVPPEALDESFLSTYKKGWRKEERGMLRRLQSAAGLLPWHPLLRQAITCYRRKQYLVVVPALLAVFEGAVARAAQRDRERKSPNAIAETQRAALDAGIVRLAWASLHGFITAVFAYRSFAEEHPELLNRHWVLHGRAKSSWGRVDCLRLLQALDTLSTVGWSATRRRT